MNCALCRKDKLQIFLEHNYLYVMIKKGTKPQTRVISQKFEDHFTHYLVQTSRL